MSQMNDNKPLNMSRYIFEPKDYTTILKDNKKINIVKKEKVDSFNESILGLGEISTKSTQVNALSVMFDLEGFTNFCRQIDPQLDVPEYLNDFLKWLFGQIRQETIESSYVEGYRLYSELPFLSKYMGDGVLFIYNTEKLSETMIMNIVVSMQIICDNYKDEFYATISKKIGSPPPKLRCGIARGAIYSVGNGNDFVGPCINMSARLQKLSSLSFCFARKGLNPDVNVDLAKSIVIKKTEIRGIGTEELVCVLKSEFDKLPRSEKVKFLNP